ncbi:hypothetical protein O181_084092 [Austropuccinia psidii MF-1]|uniref:Uncharacterized protein n=1 Tax=Austropuccinia psidii MF-1 TaxID=1389203 RepID=A0A9Q3IKN9_9BASI|nr:hypothetical protein [Austropuccinia psidii MF-1]
MSELTESSHSVPPPSVLCGSGIISQLASPWSMASSGHFDPTQTYDGYKELQTSEGINGVRKMGLLGKSSQFLRPLPLMVAQVTGSRKRDVARWTNVGGPIPVGSRPIYFISEVPISNINTEGVVKWIRKIAHSPPDPDAEGSDELDGEEVEVALNSSGNQYSTLPSHPPSKRFQIHIIPSTPRTFQPILSTIPTSLPPTSPSSSTNRPAFIPKVRPSPIHQSRNSPIVTFQQLQ